MEVPCNVIHMPCGTVAYVLHSAPARHEVMRAALVKWPEGLHDGDPMECPKCGKVASQMELQPERWAFDPGDGKVYDVAIVPLDQ